MELNENQREAVEDESSACLVKANVGSGKTTVLIEKIRYLHEKKKIPMEEMLVLTFTNRAADEIRERLEAGSLHTEGETHWYGTFHSIAKSLLEQVLPIEELGYQRNFTICLPEEELEMAKELIKARGLKIKYPNRLEKRLEQAGQYRKGRLRSLKDYQDDLLTLVDLVSEEKKKQNQMSYEDLLENTVSLLKAHPEIHRPSWIIVDEVQDCDQAQLELLGQLKGAGTSLFAVGDPNQVIYSWRGSAFNIFFRLKQEYQARELSLPVNYRSSGTILAAARRFQQGGSVLEGIRETGEKISVKNHYDPFQEGEYLAEKLGKLHETGVPWEQMAVFYRLQEQSELLEKLLKEGGVPCEVPQKEEKGAESAKAHGVQTVADGTGIETEGEGSVDPAGGGVKLMTLHASKGLEFTHVFIIGVNDGLIPLSGGSVDAKEEEQRLFYVGMTRAREFLELSYYTNPGRARVFPGPGSYLSRIPGKLIRQEDAAVGYHEDAKAAAEHLQTIKKMVLEQKKEKEQERPQAPAPAAADAAGFMSAKMPESGQEEGGAEKKDEVQKAQEERRVRHGKYGEGVVVGETEETLTVRFEGYGEKELMKAFSGLEEI